MKNFITNHKFDILFLFLITVSFCILTVLFSKYYVNLLIDFGREAYFPELMLKGKLLYKDIFNIFGPLAYQINAFLYKILGTKLSTLEVAGNFCSILVLYFVFFISRCFLNLKISIFTTIFVLFTSIFSPSVFNFIFPYSYSLLYAYTSFMGAVLFFLISLKNKEKKDKDLYLLISCFLMGISLASKIEYLLFVFVLIFYSIFIYKQKFSLILINFLSVLLVPLLSYGYLFYQGVTLSDFFNNFNLLKRYVFSDSLQYFYSHYVGSLFSFKLFKKFTVGYFFTTVLFFVVYSISFYAISCATDKPKYIKPEYIIILIGIILSFYLVSPRQLYLIVPYILFAIFLYELFKKIKNREYNFFEDIFFIFIIISMISMLKTIFILDIKYYGSFTIILPFIVILKFLSNEFKKLSNKILQTDLDNLMSSFVIILVFASFSATYSFIFESMPCIHSKRAVVNIFSKFAGSMSQVFDFVTNKTTNNESIMFFPEGVLVNFIADRDLKLYNYQSLLPPYVETFGISKVIDDIKNAKIDYIILTPRSSEEYGGRNFICKTDATSVDVSKAVKNEDIICSFIENNYYLYKMEGDYFSIYKRKNK